MDLGSLSRGEPVARFLRSPEDEVVQQVKDGRLGGAMVNALGQRGVSVTPSIKSSVESMVRALEAEYYGIAPNGSEPDSLQATATIMFTDIAGSTPTMIRTGDRRARAVFQMHDEIIRRQTAACRGQEVKSTGDGFMITFRSARGDLACSIAVQRRLDQYNDEHQDSPGVCTSDFRQESSFEKTRTSSGAPLPGLSGLVRAQWVAGFWCIRSFRR